MRAGRYSVTACFVAFARAAASCRPMTRPPLADDAARGLLPPGIRPLVPRGAGGQTLARLALLGLIDHIALRTAAIDAAIDGGFDQVVLVGAGLDARAYRLPSIGAARVFELDHPASQALKLEGVRGLVPRTRALRHVAADFVEDDLDALLAAHGHDVAAKTAWVVEGVTMYLPEAITTRLLDVVARRSAPGSLVALTYMRPASHPLPSALRRPVDLFLDAVGEPFRATYSPDEIARRLREVGLTPRSDTSSAEWAAAFRGSAVLSRPFRAERLVVASI